MKRLWRMTSCKLHVLAMICMLCDHMYRTVFPQHFILTCIGRLAFPIYAFLIVEGFFHTRDLNRYLLRLLTLAVVSEIPYNLLCGKSISYPAGQNVLWTFLLALICILCIEHHRVAATSFAVMILDISILVFSGYLLGFLFLTDYKGFGVLSVLVFYFFHGRLWWQRLGQFLGLFFINLLAGFLSGIYLSIPFISVNFPYQMFAVLCLIFLWSYTGEQGKTSRSIRLINYAFYPVHILILIWLCR